MLVKRLVCIEDLGDMDILFTDKTGTLTEGRISFTGALPGRRGRPTGELLTLGLLATEADYAEARLRGRAATPWMPPSGKHPARPGFRAGSATSGWTCIAFDHQRRRTSVLVREATADLPASSPRARRRTSWPAACARRPDVQAMLDEQFDAGSRVVAVGHPRPAGGLADLTPADEQDLVLAGFLVFLDRPKANARASLDQLAALGITVKIATGDNARVAEKVCDDLGVLVRRDAHRRRRRGHVRRRSWPPPPGGTHLRPRVARAEGPDHPRCCG